MESTYVTFEIGARWGAEKPFIPLIAPSVGTEILTGPLAALNALSCERADHLHQLIRELAKQIQVEQFSPDTYQRKIEHMLTLPKASKLVVPAYLADALQLEYPQRRERLTKSQRDILDYIASEATWRASVSQKDCEAQFKGAPDAIYWRLESLCYLGFLEKEVTNRVGTIPTYNYRLTKEYKASL